METRPFGFAPVTGYDWEQHGLFADGARVRASITRRKSRDMLAFYWALVSHVAKGAGYQKEPLSQELLIRTGYVDALSFKDGTVHAVPQSIAKMPHETFRSYVDAAIDLIIADYVTGMRRGDLLREVERMIGLSFADAGKPAGSEDANE